MSTALASSAAGGACRPASGNRNGCLPGPLWRGALRIWAVHQVGASRVQQCPASAHGLAAYALWPRQPRQAAVHAAVELRAAEAPSPQAHHRHCCCCPPPLCSWCGCNNSALMAELVPEQQRTAIFAFDRSFEVRAAAACRSHQQPSLRAEAGSAASRADAAPPPPARVAPPPSQGAVGAMGAPLVGLTAERLFGFRGVLGAGEASGPGEAGRPRPGGGGKGGLVCLPQALRLLQLSVHSVRSAPAAVHACPWPSAPWAACHESAGSGPAKHSLHCRTPEQRAPGPVGSPLAPGLSTGNAAPVPLCLLCSAGQRGGAQQRAAGLHGGALGLLPGLLHRCRRASPRAVASRAACAREAIPAGQHSIASGFFESYAWCTPPSSRPAALHWTHARDRKRALGREGEGEAWARAFSRSEARRAPMVEPP